MQPQAQYDQLTDLPSIFKPGGSVYMAVITSILTGLVALGLSSDALAQQFSLPSASAEWLNYWGAILGLTRFNGEADAQYQNRIQQTLLGATSTPAGLGKFIEDVFNVTPTITEDFTTNSYTITFADPLTTDQLDQIALTIARIRPAGVPFLPINVIAGGMFLNTLLFLGMSNAPGSYLEAPTDEYFPTNLAPNTNAIIVTLPQSYFNFPTQFPT